MSKKIISKASKQDVTLRRESQARQERREEERDKDQPKFTTSKILHDLSFEVVARRSPSLLAEIHWNESTLLFSNG
jgi:hypothetical protein